MLLIFSIFSVFFSNANEIQSACEEAVYAVAQCAQIAKRRDLSAPLILVCDEHYHTLNDYGELLCLNNITENNKNHLGYCEDVRQTTMEMIRHLHRQKNTLEQLEKFDDVWRAGDNAYFACMECKDRSPSASCDKF